MDDAGIQIDFQLNEIFTFLFLMLGPLKVLGPFAKLTARSSESDRRKLAVQGALLATVTIIGAGFIGRGILEKWNIGNGALAIAGGILFFLVALGLVLDPYSKTHNDAPAEAPGAPEASVGVALQSVLPIVISPYGIAAVVLILSLMPEKAVAIAAILLVIMLLDLIAMLFAPEILKVSALPLQIVGTILGVLQVALSVQMIIFGIRLVAATQFGFHVHPS